MAKFKTEQLQMIFSFKSLSLSVLMLFLFASCTSLKVYERPQERLMEGISFRTDELPEDELSLAEFGYADVFDDEFLQEYIRIALDSNLDVRVALENINIADSYMEQAKVIYQPTLTLNPSVSYNTSSVNTQFGRIVGDRQHLVQYNIGLQSSWEIDVWGKLKSQQKSVVANYMQTLEAHKAIRSQLVANVASGYYQLLATDAQKDVLTKTLNYREEYLETAKALKEAGLLTEVAVKQAEAQLLNVKGQLINIDYQLGLQENYIRLLMGESPAEVDRSNLESAEVNSPLQTGYSLDLLSNRPDIRAAEYNLINTFELTNAAQREFYPSFNITASTGLQSVDLSDLLSLNSIFATVAGGLTKPLLDKRNIRTNYEVSLSNQEIAFLDFRNSLLNAVQEVSNSLAAYEAQSELVNIKQEESKAYELATEYSVELVNNGLGNYLEVILANERALSARLSYIDARLAQLTSKINLYRALGGGWE